MTEEKSESGREEHPENIEDLLREDQFEPKPWRYLSDIFEKEDPFYEKILFLQGFDFSSNIYAIVGDYLTIVDAGNDYSAYMQLFKLGFKPEEIKKVVLTHGHRDHAMGAFELIRSYPSIMENGGFELIIHEEGPRELKEIYPKESGLPLTQLKGGETLDLGGFEFEVVHTPGHTIDGLCFYHAPTKTAFTGDTVLPHGMVETDKNAGGSLTYYLYGLKKLLNMEIENILPGHGDPVASLGKEVIEKTYEHAMMEAGGISPGSSWAEGAVSLAQKGLLEEALFCCERATVQDPEDIMTLQLRGMCLNDLGRCEEALEAFEQVLELKSDNIFALTGKGSALLGMEKYEESLEVFDQALEINPKMQDAMIFKGMALCLLGRYDEAMDIESFSMEFMEKFKHELSRREQSD